MAARKQASADAAAPKKRRGPDPDAPMTISLSLTLKGKRFDITPEEAQELHRVLSSFIGPEEAPAE